MKFLCFFIGIALYSKAQTASSGQHYADSLNMVLQQEISDSVKARVCFRLATYWIYKDSLQTKKYLDKGWQFSKNNPFLEGIYYYFLGQYYANIDDIPTSEATYLKADSLLGRIHTKEAYRFRSVTWQNYGVLQELKDNDKAYIDILLGKAIPLAEQAHDTDILAGLYRSVGLIFKNSDQSGKAAIYLNKAIELFKEIHSSSEEILYAYIIAAENYIYLKNTTSSKAMLDEAKALLILNPASISWVDYYQAEALYYDQLQQYEKAIRIFDKGIALGKKKDQSFLVQNMLYKKYKTLTKQKKYEQGKQILLSLIAQKEGMIFANNRLSYYHGLSETNAKLGNMGQAYTWLDKYRQLNDSLSGVNVKNYINELEAKYKNAENQKKIAVLEVEKEKAALSAKNSRLTNWLLGAVSTFMLIVATLFMFYYRNNKKLSMQKEINYKQQLKEMEQQQQLTITKAMLEGEERERRRVARDLHDGLGGMLAGVHINLSGWAANHNDHTPDTELHKIIHQLDNSLNELRHIARNMMPETLLKFGLKIALKDLCESIMSDHLHIDFQAFGIEKTIPLPAQITIYRIVQEMLSNAIRHAGATGIVVQCSQNNSSFFITVEDNGRGFDTGTLKDKTGMGLSNIKKRVEYLKGKMEIESSVNEGTTINIELDLAE